MNEDAEREYMADVADEPFRQIEELKRERDEARRQRDIAVKALREIADRLRGEPHYVQLHIVEKAEKALRQCEETEGTSE